MNQVSLFSVNLVNEAISLKVFKCALNCYPVQLPRHSCLCIIDDYSRVFTSCLIGQLDQRLSVVESICYSQEDRPFCWWRNCFLLTAAQEGSIGSWTFEGGLAAPSLTVLS